MVGCNAWGQASLSAVASTAPALLGYREFRPEEVDGARLCSIGRFVGGDVAESARRRTVASRPRRRRRRRTGDEGVASSSPSAVRSRL
jgi:hypothetical protein